MVTVFPKKERVYKKAVQRPPISYYRQVDEEKIDEEKISKEKQERKLTSSALY